MLSIYDNVHQTASVTRFNRYPTIFSACRKYFNGGSNLKLLSYGCSTGEEVLTLRLYFPDARIIGADINKYNLAKCRSRPVDEKIKFIYSSHDELSKHAHYDAIFCMAVLQRMPNIATTRRIKSLKNIYPFEKFERQIIELDSMLKRNGLLVVHYTQYSLLDTVVAYKYKPLGDYSQWKYRASVFDRNSNLVRNPRPFKSIYIKVM